MNTALNSSTPSQPNSSLPLHSFESNSVNEVPSSSSDIEKGNMQGSSKVFVFLSALVIIGGVATGAGISKLKAKGTNGDDGVYQGQKIQTVADGAVQNGQIFGSANESDFKDSAEGFLQAGGVDGEGTHKLLREGGITQTVYLTSSVTDLSKFEGMKVKVWGETNQSRKAGWLMDVGRVQVLETKGQVPTE
jgi:hypothetical protein